MKVVQSCLTFCNPMDYTVHGIFQVRILEWVECSLSQEIFPTQGLKPGLPHCRRILYQLSHHGSPPYWRDHWQIHIKWEREACEALAVTAPSCFFPTSLTRNVNILFLFELPQLTPSKAEITNSTKSCPNCKFISKLNSVIALSH